MKWEDYRKGADYTMNPVYAITDIECPKCGEKIYMDTTLEYLSNPPQHDFYCFKCGWKGQK